MKMSLFLEDLRTRGVLPPRQYEALQEIISGKVLSLFIELRALLYLGILAILAGVGWIIRDYFAQLGHIIIIGSLSFSALAAIAYCFTRSNPYSNGEVESPSLVFDYILYLGCALYSLNLAYIETQFHLFGSSWPTYLLISSIGFFLLAYRFDNQLVLSLALSTLAAYFGFKLAGWQMIFQAYYRPCAILYGTIVLLIGIVLRARSIKKHFFDIFANFAAHFMFIASISGILEFGARSLYFPLLALLCLISTAYCFASRNFLYLFYAVLYGYFGATVIFIKTTPSPNNAFLYFIFSSILVGYLVYRIYLLSRVGGEEE
jgi:hypothetical protein